MEQWVIGEGMKFSKGKCQDLLWAGAMLDTELCVQFWASLYRRHVSMLKHIQKKVTKLVTGLEGMSCKRRLRTVPVSVQGHRAVPLVICSNLWLALKWSGSASSFPNSVTPPFEILHALSKHYLSMPFCQINVSRNVIKTVSTYSYNSIIIIV